MLHLEWGEQRPNADFHAGRKGPCQLSRAPARVRSGQAHSGDRCWGGHPVPSRV